MRAFAATIRCVILCVPAARSAPQQSPSPSPSSAQPDLAAGKLVFEGRCSLCHGIDGGGGEDELPPDDVWGAIKALQAESGDLRWEFKLHSPPWAGVLSTAGGLVFSGSDEGNFYALDARTGKPLWDFQTGGAIIANPVSFTVDGHQCIAIAADRVLYVFGLYVFGL